MAENENGLEKTEDPTPRRLEQAREKGQVPRSRELSTMAVLLTGAAGLFFLGGYFARSLHRLLVGGFSLDRALLFDADRAAAYVGWLILQGLQLTVPLLLMLLIASLLAPVVLGGWTMSSSNIAFKFEKLDPIKGLGRIFGWQGLMELAKALGKFVLVAGGAVLLLDSYLDELLALPFGTLEGAMLESARILGIAFVTLSALLILIAAIDVPFQLWQHTRQLRMTRQEVKDEFKETEGKPEVKQRMRALQREVSAQRIGRVVPTADVVITNPQHYAVAIKYEQEYGAPRVVAKGMDDVAAVIRRVATEHEVPLVPAPPLARALFYSTRLNQQIPAGLYLAVAQVLAYVYQLNAAEESRALRRPRLPDTFPVPEEYQYPA
jgi:flagellar biosynthetic protein FlhB